MSCSQVIVELFRSPSCSEQVVKGYHFLSMSRGPMTISILRQSFQWVIVQCEIIIDDNFSTTEPQVVMIMKRYLLHRPCVGMAPTHSVLWNFMNNIKNLQNRITCLHPEHNSPLTLKTSGSNPGTSGRSWCAEVGKILGTRQCLDAFLDSCVVKNFWRCDRGHQAHWLIVLLQKNGCM